MYNSEKALAELIRIVQDTFDDDGVRDYMLNAVKQLRNTFDCVIDMTPVQTVVYVVHDVVYPHYVLKPIIDWMDSKHNEWKNIHDLTIYATKQQISTALAILELEKVLEKSDDDDVLYRKGMYWVDFCVACGFEIEETHS